MKSNFPEEILKVGDEVICAAYFMDHPKIGATCIIKEVRKYGPESWNHQYKVSYYIDGTINLSGWYHYSHFKPTENCKFTTLLKTIMTEEV